MKKRIRNYDRTAANDIRYRGPLSYRHLLIMGWISASFVVLAVLTHLGISLDPNSPGWMFSLHTVSESIGSFIIPLFLLANFCIILDEKQTYKELLLKYAALSLLIVAVYLVVFRRYLFGIMNVFFNDAHATAAVIDVVLREGTRTGTLMFNIFIDLFLCTLFMFFLNSEPKGFFAGRMRLFRALAIIPVLYEAGSLAVRVLSSMGKIEPHFLVYPFLTTKPPFSFVMFIALALFIWFRQRRFLHHGKSREDYRSFLKTNANSLQFSVFTTVVILITCLADLALFVVLYDRIYNDPDRFIAQYQMLYSEETVSYEADPFAALFLEGEPLMEGSFISGSGAAEASDEWLQPESEELFQEAGEMTPEEREVILKKAMEDERTRDLIMNDVSNQIQAWGIGRHVPLVLLIPFVLLFSYTRNHKNPRADILIPVAGIILALIVLIEGLYQGILMFLPPFLNSMGSVMNM